MQTKYVSDYSNVNTAFKAPLFTLKNKNSDNDNIYYDNYSTYHNNNYYKHKQNYFKNKINICLCIFICVILLVLYWYFFVREKTTSNSDAIYQLNRKINELI